MGRKRASHPNAVGVQLQPHLDGIGARFNYENFGPWSPSSVQDLRTGFQLDKSGQRSPNGFHFRELKRAKMGFEENDFHAVSIVSSLQVATDEKLQMPPSNVIDYSDPYALSKHLEGLDIGEYGSATKEYEAVHAHWMQLLNVMNSMYPKLSSSRPCSLSQPPSEICQSAVGLQTVNLTSTNDQRSYSMSQAVIDLEIDGSATNPDFPSSGHGGRNAICSPGSSIAPTVHGKLTFMPSDHSDLSSGSKDGMPRKSVIVLDSDEEDGADQSGDQQPPNFEPVVLNFEAKRESQIQSLTNLKKQMGQEYAVLGNALTCTNNAVEANYQIPYPYEKVVLKSPVEANSVVANCQISYPYEKVVLKSPVEANSYNDLVVPRAEFSTPVFLQQKSKNKKRGRPKAQPGMETTVEGKCDRTPDEFVKKEKTQIVNMELGTYIGVEEDAMALESHQKDDLENDGLTDIWKEMTLAMEFTKDVTSDNSVVQTTEQECEHSCFLKDDLGYVCRICGVIQKSIETIFDYQWIKGTKSTRTYMPESRNTGTEQSGITNFSRQSSDLEKELLAADILVHPRHMKQMKPHQLEGFNFLLRNLVSEKPGGCILAHAPGSGKTFMIISFIQSFLAKYPHARPLVVLPKGILSTWKKEFLRWQIEDIPLLDFYTVKADKRSQQLEVLENWVEQKSILFLGYKQFANIVCGSAVGKTAAACLEMLLTVPTLLILDEGHTPRNENTDVLHSLAKVKTPRKVVLSGTLFQNHVREVFNILNLVRPKFLKLEPSRSVVRRVLSRVNISGGSRRQCRTGVDTTFFDLVEETLQNDEDFKRKITVIQDLREMTNSVLHYYKGDFLDELPGLLDFTVLLNLSSKQKEVVKRLQQLEKFRRSAVGTAVYMHPKLKDISENAAGDKCDTVNVQKIDQLVEKMDVKEGVKTKFFLNILGLSESAGEKLLVFSQYLLPLKFLERLLIHLKGWSPGKEIFMISGDSSPEDRERSMDQFNNSPDAKVFFGSIKACGEGISLVGASRILILDVHLNPSVTRQAIGRAFRPGQLKKVYTYRLVAAETAEEYNHNTSFRKELISKMWFEWTELCSLRDFEMEEISPINCEDMFLESPLIAKDVKILYKR